MRRGDIAIAAAPGDYGKPRPVLIMQSDAFELPSVTVIPFTSDLRDAPLFRLPVAPDTNNGLRVTSQLMVDKVVTLPRAKIGPPVGTLDGETIRRATIALRRFLDMDVSA